MKWARKVAASSARPSGQSREACQGTGLMSTVTVSGSSGAGGGSREVRTEEQAPHEVTQWAGSRPQGTEGCCMQKTQQQQPPPPTHTQDLAQCASCRGRRSGLGLAWPTWPCASRPLPHRAPLSPALPLSPAFSSPNTVHSLLPRGLCTGHAGPPSCASLPCWLLLILDLPAQTASLHKGP